MPALRLLVSPGKLPVSIPVAGVVKLETSCKAVASAELAAFPAFAIGLIGKAISKNISV
jgi:hypothetical protein